MADSDKAAVAGVEFPAVSDPVWMVPAPGKTVPVRLALRITNQSWSAVAYLSTANFGTDTLTVYDGVAYGFTTLIFPEPGSLALCGIAAAGFAGASWRNRKKKTAGVA